MPSRVVPPPPKPTPDQEDIMLTLDQWCVEDERPIEVDSSIMSILLQENGEFPFEAFQHGKNPKPEDEEDDHYGLTKSTMTTFPPPPERLKIVPCVSTAEMCCTTSNCTVTTTAARGAQRCSFWTSHDEASKPRVQRKEYIPISPHPGYVPSCSAGTVVATQSAAHTTEQYKCGQRSPTSSITSFSRPFESQMQTSCSSSSMLLRSSTYVDYMHVENCSTANSSSDSSSSSSCHPQVIIGNLVDAKTSLKSNQWITLDFKMLDANQGKTSRRDIDTFPKKMMRMLSQEGIDHIISWLPHGRAFIIRDQKLFESEVRPRFFKPTKFQSFLRQMHLWQFQRIKTGPDTGAYYHELFLRGKPDLLYWMTTSGSGKASKLSSVDDFCCSRKGKPPNFYALPALPEVAKCAEPMPPLSPLLCSVNSRCS